MRYAGRAVAQLACIGAFFVLMHSPCVYGAESGVDGIVFSAWR